MQNGSLEYDMMTPASRVAAILREEICSGKYAVGMRLANERDLAQRFEVSRGTIRQTLQILAQERLIIRQQGRGTFVADPAYAPVAGSKTALIGALIYEKEYFFGAILQGASAHSTNRGYMLTTGSNSRPELEEQHVDAFLENGIQGVILAPVFKHSTAAYDRLREHNVPVVMLDMALPDREEDLVGVDDSRGTALALQHLIEQGHQRIAYVGHDHPEDVACQWNRLMGFRAGCRQGGIDIPPSWCIEVADEDDLRSRLTALLQEKARPTAIVTHNDIWALSTIRMAQQMGYDVPGDLSVVGFDDSTLARSGEIALTTVNPEPYELGVSVVNLLIEKIENPRVRPKYNLMVEPHLEIRDSTAPPRT